MVENKDPRATVQLSLVSDFSSSLPRPNVFMDSFNSWRTLSISHLPAIARFEGCDSCQFTGYHRSTVNSMFTSKSILDYISVKPSAFSVWRELGTNPKTTARLRFFNSAESCGGSFRIFIKFACTIYVMFAHSNFLICMGHWDDNISDKSNSLDNHGQPSRVSESMFNWALRRNSIKYTKIHSNFSIAICLHVCLRLK